MFDNNTYKEARLLATDGDIIPDRAYNAIIGLVVLWGFAINYMLATRFSNIVLNLSPIVLLVGYFVLSLGSIFLIHRSNNPVVSFVGFTVLAAAMGAILVWGVQSYTTADIVLAVRITGVVTAIMLILAVIYPDFFLGLGRTLLISLGVCLIIEVVCRLFLQMQMAIMDYVVALIFCGYIGYDWSVAQRYPKTVDNAIDSAADIYIDIINLFIRILAITGKGSSRSQK